MNDTRFFLAFRSARFGMAIAAFALATLLPNFAHAAPNENLLTGSVRTGTGAKMAGATVSAQAEGKPITVSVQNIIGRWE